jgi:hypothetical protein
MPEANGYRRNVNCNVERHAEAAPRPGAPQDRVCNRVSRQGKGKLLHRGGLRVRNDAGPDAGKGLIVIIDFRMAILEWETGVFELVFYWSLVTRYWLVTDATARYTIHQ